MSNSDNIRTEYGQASMNVMDAMDDTLVDALEQLAEAAATVAAHLTSHGVTKQIGAGLVVGIALEPFTA